MPKKKVKSLGDQVEELDAMGQENEVKAAKWVIEKGKEVDQEEQQIKDLAHEILEKARKGKELYRQGLLKQVFRLIHTMDVPMGYHIGAFYTSKGLVVWVMHKKKWFAKGMKVTGEVKYDLNGVDRIMVKAADFIDGLVDDENKTESGIYLK